MSNSTPVARYVISGLLVAGIAALLWIALSEKNHTEIAKQRLQARAQHYAQLRLEGDWPQLYHMVDPVQRRTTSLVQFLQVFGSGALKVHKMDFLEFALSPNDRVAWTKFDTSVELDQSKLPPIAQKLQVPDPSALRRDDVFVLDWAFRVSKETPKGEWYWRMGTPEATGKDPQGNPIKKLDELGNQPPAPAPSGSGLKQGN